MLVDDEPLARSYLSTILSERDDVILVGQCASGREAIDSVLEQRPDLVFLDIQMPGLTGFDVIEHIQADLMPKIVFTTAYAEFAVEAFKVGAVNYVLKPLDEAQIFESLDRAKTLITPKATLLSALSDAASQTSLIVKDGDIFTQLDVDSIVWIEAAGDYICIHYKSGARLIRSTLKAVLQRLEGTDFIQIHRSTLVNLCHVSQTQSGFKGELILRLSSGEALRASRRYSRAVKDKLAEMAL